MGIKFNGTTVKKIYYNNKEIRRVFYDDISSNDYYDQRQVFSSGATITLEKESWFSSHLEVIVKVNNSPVNLPATVKAGDYVSIRWLALTNYSIICTSCTDVLEDEWYTSGNPVFQKTRTFTVGSYSSDTTLWIDGNAARCLYPDATYGEVYIPGKGNQPIFDYDVAPITHSGSKYSEAISGHVTLNPGITQQFAYPACILDIVCLSVDAESNSYERVVADSLILDIKEADSENWLIPLTGNWDPTYYFNCYYSRKTNNPSPYKPPNAIWRFYFAPHTGWNETGGVPRWSDKGILSKPYNNSSSIYTVHYLDVTVYGIMG